MSSDRSSIIQSLIEENEKIRGILKRMLKEQQQHEQQHVYTPPPSPTNADTDQPQPLSPIRSIRTNWQHIILKLENKK